MLYTQNQLKMVIRTAIFLLYNHKNILNVDPVPYVMIFYFDSKTDNYLVTKINIHERCKLQPL